ncbi:MAG: hypothetical protein WCX71_05640 [Candidatus Buchananbacteria bacterium]
MLMQKKLSKSRLIIYIVIITVLVLGSLYLLYESFIAGMFVVPSEPSDSMESPVENLTVPSSELMFTDDFIHRAPYQNLKMASDKPLVINQLGRSNPFSPINYNSVSTSTKP